MGKVEIKLQSACLHAARWFLFLFVFPVFVQVAQAIVPWTILINTNNVINVTNFGAAGDGVFTNTMAISNAITAAAAGGTTNGLIGGTVEIPGPGTYLCGPLVLKNNVNLQVDAGAILLMLPLNKYPMTWITNGANYWFTNTPNFITANSLTNIELSGSGAIDGQGAPWWPYANTNNAVRAVLVSWNSCNRQLIQNITLSNSPMFHIAIGSSKNSTVQEVIVRAPSTSPNTDACDVSGTNILVQNCNISEGDDDYTCGGGTHDVLLTNNTYGTGHGISIGSFTDKGGVSNIMVINCTISGAANGIRIKSDNDRGGLVQNISYINIGITNVNFPIQVYGYYHWFGTPSGITPQIAASTNAAAIVYTNVVGMVTNVFTNIPPIYRNITFSNIYGTSVGGFPAAIIWPRTEMPGTNIVFNKVNVSASRPFEIYNARGVQLIDCQISGNNTNLWLYNAQVIVSNSAPTNALFTLDGLTTNGYGNSFVVFNSRTSLKNTNCFDDGPLTLGAGTFIVSNNLALFPSTVLNFWLGTNAATVSVISNLALGGSVTFTNGPGFTNGTYTLLTYNGALSGALPTLGTVPPGYNYSLDTGTVGQVKLVVTLLAPTNLTAVPTNLQINLKWNSVIGATNYNLKRGTTTGGPYPTMFSGLTATNYADANVTNAVNYFYVVTAVGAGGESANSLQAAAVPLPSNQPTNISLVVSNGQMQLSWPQDHLGWRLQIQTNNLAAGLSTNWATVPNSTNVMATNIVINPANDSVFLRLVYP